MRVGVPKEIKVHEYRVGLTPASVAELVAAGHEVVVADQAPATASTAPTAPTRRPARKSFPTPRRCSRRPT